MGLPVAWGPVPRHRADGLPRPRVYAALQNREADKASQRADAIIAAKGRIWSFPYLTEPPAPSSRPSATGTLWVAWQLKKFTR